MPVFDVTPILRPEREALLDLLVGVEGDEWLRPTECPAWSVSGVALHILGDDLSLLARQRDAATPGLFRFAEHHPGLDFRLLLDGFNEQWVTASSFLSPALVVGLLRLTGEWTAAFYEEIDLESSGEPVGFFAATGPSPYWQIAAREYVERWVHQHQIRRALGRRDLGDQFLEPVAAVVARSLAAHLPDLGARPGTTVGFEVADLAAWTLTRVDGGWLVADGADTDVAAKLVVDHAPATRILSRGAGPVEAAEAVEVTGAEELAGGLLTVCRALITPLEADCAPFGG